MHLISIVVFYRQGWQPGEKVGIMV